MELISHKIWNDGYFIILVAERLQLRDLSSFAQTNKTFLLTIYEHFKRKYKHSRIRQNLPIKRKNYIPENLQFAGLAYKLGRLNVGKSNEHNWYMAESTTRLEHLHKFEETLDVKDNHASVALQMLMPLVRWLRFLDNVKHRKLSIFFDIPSTYFTDQPATKYYYYDGAWIQFRVLVGPVEYGHTVRLKMMGSYWAGFREFDFKWARNVRLENGLEVEEWQVEIAHNAFYTTWYPYVDFLTWFEAEAYVCDSNQQQVWDDNSGNYFQFRLAHDHSYRCGQIVRKSRF